MLELYATEGLNPGSVHLAQLRLGQGLVGTIAASARALNLSDAQQHPAFAYLPETGEEIYNSFLGVPVLRAGRTLGVLVVQNRTKRQYRDDEVEALETTAMVIAEMIAAGELARLTRPGLELDLRRPVSFTGISFNDGVGLGHVVLHEPRIVVTNLFNEDSDEEMRRLETALGSLRLSIDDMLSRRDVAFEGEHRAVLEAYRMFANDQGWVRRLEEAVRNGLTAEAAVEKVQSDMRARMLHMTDPYLRERMSDFDDLANRLLRLLMGRGPDDVAAALPKDAIIVARSMGAAELLDYPRDKLRGLVLEDGAVTSHVVIVARAMGIPVAGQVKGAVSMSENGDAIIVDGDEGTIHLRPQPDLEAAYAEKVRFRARRQELYRELRKKPSESKDGVKIDLMMNAGLAVDLPQLAESGAAGIGLFRTELQFMVASTFPRAEAQERLYRDVLDAARDKPVTFRTIDIGGDKVLPYFKNVAHEENPALGWRAIRLTLDRPGLLAHADPRAAEGRRRARAARHAADGHGAFRDRAGARDHRQGSAASVALRPSSADQPEARRHARSAGAALAARRADEGGRFRLGRLERSVPVRHGDRSRQHAALRPLRPAVGAVPARPEADRRRRRAQPHAGDALRRACRQADLGDGADRPRLPLDLDVAGLDRPGQGDADGAAASASSTTFFERATSTGHAAATLPMRALLQAFADDRGIPL